jgi:soluble P-type ATPase
VKTIDIPGWGSVEFTNLVLDLNGTITESGSFIPGVIDCLEKLKERGLAIYVLSGDTRGTVRDCFQSVPGVDAIVTKTAEEKKQFVESIGPLNTICIGNGNIDVDMFKVAKLAICTVQAEGATIQAMMNADIVVTHINQALEILLDEEKLIATLRS